MSKINNVRLPTTFSAFFDPTQFNQLSRSLEHVVQQLNSTYTPNTSEDKIEAQTWFMGK